MKQKIIGICICLLLTATSLSMTGMALRIEKEIQETPVFLSGNTIYVGGNGPNNYTTIQDGINHANPGDTVYVLDDSSPYNEHISISKPLTLLGENRDSTIIDPLGQEDIDGIFVSAAYVTISGFTIQNVGPGWGNATVKITANRCQFNNNKVFSSGPSIGGFLISSSYNVLVGNIISTYRGSFGFSGASFNAIINNTITTTDATCIRIDESSNNNTFTDNIITRLASSDSYEVAQIFFSSGNKFIGNTITNEFGKGFWIYGANTIIKNNTITTTSAGIEPSYSSNGFTATGNHFIHGGILIRSGSLQQMKTFTIEQNDINGKPLLFYKNMANLVIDNGSPGQVILVNCTNALIHGLTFTDVYYPVQLAITTLSTLSDNSFTDNYCAVYLFGSSYNTLSSNIMTNNYYGVLQYQYLVVDGETQYNLIQDNVIMNNDFGIYTYDGPHDTSIINNVISNNTHDGIMFLYGDDNYIIGNTIANNGGRGINLCLVQNSHIYHNTFINNNLQARDYSQSYNYINSWDNGYPSGGNYWSDHCSHDGYQGPNQNIPGSDGIVDKIEGGKDPVNITDGNNKDWYPLMHRFVLGDMNVNGVVDFGDINSFVLALTDPDAYQNTYHLLNSLHGDINQDGVFNFGDINPFVALLTGG